MIGNRFSSLPVAQFCPLAPTLESASGRSAIQSSAFHAKCAGDLKRFSELANHLTPEELSELDSWHCPPDVVLPDGTTLRYQDSEKELRVGLDASLGYCDPDSEECVSAGTLDGAWTVVHGNTVTAYVYDIKRSEYTSQHDSLQIVGYGYAYASLMKADYLATGIWAAMEGEWSWGPVMEPYSLGTLDLEAKLGHAMQNRSDDPRSAVRGQHCSSCYGRMRCPEYVMHGVSANAWLAPLADGHTKLLNHEDALRVLLGVKAVEDVAERAKKLLQFYAEVHGGIPDPSTGKVWKPVKTQGRESFDKEAAAADGVDVKKYMKRGKAFSTFRWLNQK